MKTILPLLGWSARALPAALLFSCAVVLAAEDEAAKPLYLSSEISRVVKMHEAGVADGVLKAYVENSKTLSAPTAEEIVYLHSINVSDPIIVAAIQNGQSRGGSAPSTVPAATPVSVASQYSQPATAYAQPPVVYVQQPVPVYVSPPPVYYDYGYCAPYYYGYYGYRPAYYGGFYPAVSFGFRFGGSSHFHGGGIHVVGGHSTGGHHR